MVSHTRKQIIAIRILSNISRTKGNQAKLFRQLIEYNVRNIFLQKSCQNKAVGIVSELFWFFEKTLYKEYTRKRQVTNTLFLKYLIDLDFNIQ